MGVHTLTTTRGRHRAIFLDRDGVLNANILNPATGQYESPLRPEDFELLPGVLPALSALQSAGFLLFLVSNQPNHAKAKASLETLEAIHLQLTAQLREAGISFTRFYYCFHHPNGVTPGYAQVCPCRKPSPYFLLQAAEDFNLDLELAWMIGDRPADIACGRAAGVRTIRIGATAPSEPCPDSHAHNLSEAVQIVVQSQAPSPVQPAPSLD